MAAAEGCWAPRRPAVGNCGLRLRNRRGRFGVAPQGALQMKPATSSCRAFCAASTHGRWPRVRALGPDTAGRWKLRPSIAKPPGRFSAAPVRGAWQMKPATSSCRAFRAASTHGCWARPRAVAPTRPAVGNCGLRGARPPGAVGALTPLPLPSPLSQPWERGEGEHASSHSGAGAAG